jgi:hypothetical protein
MIDDAVLRAARPLSVDEVLATSGGPIDSPETYDYGTLEPEPGGLYAEEFFGPVDLRAGGGEGDAARPDRDLRGDRWGHVALAEVIAHPLRDDLPLAHVLIVPPAHRRFFQQSAEASRVAARERRREILAMGEEPYGDPVDKVLAEEGLLDEADIDARGPTWVEPPLNGHYRAVVNINHHLRRLRELEAPAQPLAEARERLVFRVKNLFEHLWSRRADLGDGVLLRALSLIPVDPPDGPSRQRSV